MSEQHPEIPFNPDMLLCARKAAAMTQRQLAAAAGITQGYLSKFENGRSTPTMEQRAALASALGVGVEMFTRPNRHIGIPVGLYRTRAIGATERARLEASLDMARFEITRLLEVVDVEPSLHVPSWSVEADGTPEECAQMLRESWGIPQGPLHHLTFYLESAGLVLLPWPNMPDGVDAVWVRSVGSDAEFIAYNPNAPGDRIRFTLAHELGHKIMHEHVYDGVEEEANRFAAELLMPTKLIRAQLRQLNLTRAIALKEHWQTSIASLIYRAGELRAIEKKTQTYLFAELGRRGWKRREPVDISIDEPTILRQILEAHLDQLGYDINELAAALHLSENTFLARYGAIIPGHLDVRHRLRLVHSA